MKMVWSLLMTRTKGPRDVRVYPISLPNSSHSSARFGGSSTRASGYRAAERVGVLSRIGLVKVVFSYRHTDGGQVALVTDDVTLTPKEVTLAG